MASELQIRCLGRLTLHSREASEPAGRELPLPATLKSQSLLAYLVVHRDRPQSRDRLAELFWGDRPEHNARRSLATALWQIRRCLPGDDFILAGAASVQFNPHSVFWLDVAEFEKLLQAPDTSVSALQAVGMDAEAIEAACRACSIRLMEAMAKQLNPNLSYQLVKFRTAPDGYCEEAIVLA